MELKMPKSKRGAVRKYNAIMRRARRELRGGLTFGLDWSTFRALYWEEAKLIVAMRDAYPSLPD
jgi:hypothetical protein